MAKKNAKSVTTVDGVNGEHGEQAHVAQSRSAVRVECPSEGEAVARPDFTVHIVAMSGAQGVDVSIDQGEWMPCRESLGLWWYDWSGYVKGAHVLLARTRMADGVITNSAPRRFSVS